MTKQIDLLAKQCERKVSRGVGRPALPQGEKRVQIAARVAPKTAAWLAQEKDRSGVSLGAILDDAVMAYRDTRTTNMRTWTKYTGFWYPTWIDPDTGALIYLAACDI